MSSQPIQIVDENDEPIGQSTIVEAQTNGLLHRIARVMVEDKAGRVLLQKRLPTMPLYPGRWDNSAAGHVDAGESYETAAYRELAEEIGLRGVKLEDLGQYKSQATFEWRRLNRFTRVYKVVVPAGTTFTVQPDEVASVKWFTVHEAKRLIAEQPDEVTDGIVDVFNRFYDENHSH